MSEHTTNDLPALSDFETSLVSPDASEALKRGHELHTHGGYDFPSGPAHALYNSTLDRVPFVICSEPIFRTRPAKQIAITDAAGRLVQKMLPPQEVVHFQVRVIDLRTHTYRDVEVATLNGAYLLNQVRSLMADRHSFLYSGAALTVRRNPAFTTPSGASPYMLDWYDSERDTDGVPDEENIPFDSAPATPPARGGKSAARR